MLLYWVKCKKNTENVDPKVPKLVTQCYHQNVSYVAVKDHDL